MENQETFADSWQSSIQEIGTPLHSTTFVVLDLETSGGAPHRGAGITEIGAVKIRSGEVIDTFSTLVNPGHPIPSYITTLTGIDDALVNDCPPIEHVLEDLLKFLGPIENVFVAQNAPFDLSFIKAALSLHGYQWPAYRVLDTAIIARRALSRDEAPNCKLATLAEIFGAEIKPSHRALDDAQATVDVLHGLFERLAGFDVYTVEEALSFSAPKKSQLKKSQSIERPSAAVDL
jgi:DNA polymerase III epsilon subunit family exonuclease